MSSTASNTIKTNTLDTLTTTDNMLIGNATNTGKITLSTINTGNSNSDPAISIGVETGTKTIKINNNSNSVHCSSIDLQGSQINNIVNATGDVSIGNLQTTAGVLNLGTAGARAGLINIGNGATRTGQINIGTGGGSGQVNIGSSSATTATGALTASGVITASAGVAMGSQNITGTGTINATTFVGNLTGTASNATNATTATNANNVITTLENSSGLQFCPTFVSTAASGIGQGTKISANLKYVPLTNNLIANTFTGDLAGNAQTATNASNANFITMFPDSATSADCFPTFVALSTATSQQPRSSINLKYRPDTNTLTVANLTGTASNATLAATATDATNATNVNFTADTASATDCFPTFVTTSTTGNKAPRVSVNLKYRPSTGVLTAGSFTGNLTGTATNATTAANATNVTMGAGNNITLSGTVKPVVGQLGYVLPIITGTQTTAVDTAKDLCNTGSLAAGTWLIVANFSFPVIASGAIYCWIAPTSATYSSRVNAAILQPGTTIQQTNCIYLSTSTTAITYYASTQVTAAVSITGTISATRLA